MLYYKNGKDILPKELLIELQKYIQGELLYIPKTEQRKAWGESNGTRDAMKERNFKIYSLYHEGITITELTKLYNLSEDSIRKIIFKVNTEKIKINAISSIVECNK